MVVNGQLHAPADLPPTGAECIGGCVGPRAGLAVLKKRKISSPAEIRTPDLPPHSLVIIPTTLSWLLKMPSKGNVSRGIWFIYFVWVFRETDFAIFSHCMLCHQIIR